MSDQVATDELIIGPVTILAHDHDEVSGVYRLVIGREVRTPAFLHEVHVLDDEGQPTYHSVPLLDSEKNPVMRAEAVLDDQGQLQFEDDDDPETVIVEMVPVVDLVPVTAPENVPEQVVGHADVQDYVFADDDDRWFDANGDRRPDGDVAAEQRQTVKDALDEAAAQAAIQAEPPRGLPGVGDEL